MQSWPILRCQFRVCLGKTKMNQELDRLQADTRLKGLSEYKDTGSTGHTIRTSSLFNSCRVVNETDTSLTVFRTWNLHDPNNSVTFIFLSTTVITTTYRGYFHLYVCHRPHPHPRLKNAPFSVFESNFFCYN